MIEVHNNPAKALSDGAQSLTPEAFASLMEKVKAGVQVCTQTPKLDFPF
jgi:3-deoxy-7-phosphoheptulonate synthase